MLIKPSDHPKFLSTFVARASNDHRQSSGAMLEVRAGSIESFDQIDLKPPVSALQRPFSSKAWGRNPSSQTDTNQKPASFSSKKSKTQVKPHQNVAQEKNPAPLSMSMFNKIPPLLKQCDNIKLSLSGSHIKGSSSLSYRTSKDGMIFDMGNLGNADSVVQGKEASNPSMTKNKLLPKKKSPSVQVSPERMRKSALPEPEKAESSPSHILFSGSGLEPQKVDSISTRLKNGLPITKLNALAVHVTGHRIEEKNTVKSAREHEEGFHSDRQSDYREQEHRKVREPAMSQAMFRMKHYQKNKEAKEGASKKNKEAKDVVSMALENSMKSFTQRQFVGLSNVSDRFNSKEWKKEVFKTLETEIRDVDRLFTDEFGRHSTLSTYAGSPNDFAFIKKRTSTMVPESQTTLSKAIKFNDYQKEKQEIMKKFFTDNGSLKVLGNEKQTHFERIEKEKGQEDPQKSNKMSPNNTKKVDMQMFLNSLGNPKTPRSYPQNMNHIGMFKTEGEKTPRRAEQKLTERKSEKRFSTFTEKQQIELEKMAEKKDEMPKLEKVESQKSIDLRQSAVTLRLEKTESQRSIEPKQSTSNVEVKLVKKVSLKTNKVSMPTNTPKAVSIAKQNLNEKFKSIVEKEKEMTPKDESRSPKKKRTYNNLAEVGELSQLSIKQFEMSGSWNHDDFEIMQQRSQDYLSSEIK